jgi:hypothetical protein
VITAAWVLGCWCVASLAVAAAWSAFRTHTKRHHAEENALRVPQTGWGAVSNPAGADAWSPRDAGEAS